jgi:hypothetical protein
MTLLRTGSLIAFLMLASGAVPAFASHEGIFELFIYEEPPDYDEPPARRKPRKRSSGSIFDLFEERGLQPIEKEQSARRQRKLASKPVQKKAKSAHASRVAKVRQVVRKTAQEKGAFAPLPRATVVRQSNATRDDLPTVDREIAEERPKVASLPKPAEPLLPRKKPALIPPVAQPPSPALPESAARMQGR